jgi:chaperone LolA
MSFLIAVLLFLAPQRPVSTPGLTDIVDGVVRTYSRMNDFSAEFVKTTTDSSNQTHTFRGLLYLKNGRKMVFDQQTPFQEITYSDGKTYVIYRPERKQAETSSLGKAEDERIQLFQIPWNPKWKDQFERFAEGGKEKPVNPAFRVITATPKKKDLPVIVLEVDPATFLIHRFKVTSPDGETDEFQFTGLKTARLDPSIFQFKPPPNVKVIKNR